MAITPKTNGLMMMQMRSGSTMLAACLDSHFQIHCPRQEPLNPRELERLGQGVTQYNRAVELYNIHGYRASIFKATMNQLTELDTSFWKDHKVKVLTLTRPNLIRAWASLAIPQGKRGAWHDLDGKHKFEPFVVDVHTVLQELAAWQQWEQGVKQWPYQHGIKAVLHLTYDEIQNNSTYSEGITYLSWELSERLCKFFGVEVDGRLKTEYKRLNPTPLNELILNWAEVEKLLRSNGYAPLLDKYGMLKG
jgi:hypothetical protein